MTMGGVSSQKLAQERYLSRIKKVIESHSHIHHGYRRLLQLIEDITTVPRHIFQ